MKTDRETVTQCALRDGARNYVAFIPSKFAVRGKKVTIDDVPGDWTVVAVYETKPVAEMNERSRDHAHYREFSDA